jgi:hypothetical protein
MQRMIGLFGIGPPFQRQCILWKPVLVVFVFVWVPARWALFFVTVDVDWTVDG